MFVTQQQAQQNVPRHTPIQVPAHQSYNTAPLTSASTPQATYVPAEWFNGALAGLPQLYSMQASSLASLGFDSFQQQPPQYVLAPQPQQQPMLQAPLLTSNEPQLAQLAHYANMNPTTFQNDLIDALERELTGTCACVCKFFFRCAVSNSRVITRASCSLLFSHCRMSRFARRVAGAGVLPEQARASAVVIAKQTTAGITQKQLEIQAAMAEVPLVNRGFHFLQLSHTLLPLNAVVFPTHTHTHTHVQHYQAIQQQEQQRITDSYAVAAAAPAAVVASSSSSSAAPPLAPSTTPAAKRSYASTAASAPTVAPTTTTTTTTAATMRAKASSSSSSSGTTKYNPTQFDTSPSFARFFVIKSFSEDDVHKSIKVHPDRAKRATFSC
jgi:hypothetical protein